MPAGTPPLDLVTVAIAVASALLGVSAGTIAGTYSVIILCALGGACWSASNVDFGAPEYRRLRAGLHIALRVGLALVCTVPLSELVATAWPQLHVRWTLAPLAVIVAGQPRWALRLLRAAFERVGIVERRT